jgi:glycosyltransferase involved in cell wall biosynthesis
LPHDSCQVSVVVPTRNEADNIVLLVQRIDAALSLHPSEIIFVDDSDDATPEIVRALAAGRNGDGPVILVHRDRGARAGGLGGAVVEGIRRARGEYVCVIDADLQHPPSALAALVARAQAEDRPDLVVGTRYADGGASGLRGIRAAVSRGSNRVARRAVPARLRGITDLMSGLFLVRRTSIDVDRLQPQGFKVLFEIVARHPELVAAEVGYEFGSRHAGESKASAGEGLTYLRQVRRLRTADRYRRDVGAHVYDIHGIVTVCSDARLPELEAFRIRQLTTEPTIRVRIGDLPKQAPVDDDASAPLRRHFRYREWMGNLGFAADVTVEGLQVDILATPLLRRSPHVLYTNLVEPVLRWTMVKLGYALAHGAVFVDDDRAYMVTARTDTGKTTTMLKLLDANPGLSFIADDLSIVKADGTVMSYPKPMTISQHTVHAVHTPYLKLPERATLGLQSRLHSREGRIFAFFLAKSGLPVATVNTIVQFLVPPPKYPVGRLVPGVPSVRSANFSGLFVISRGDSNTTEPLDTEDAREILIANTDDAYGFPPYAELEAFLLAATGDDLRAIESAIITGVLGSAPAFVLTSDRLNWAERIPSLIADSERVIDLTDPSRYDETPTLEPSLYQTHTAR